MQIYDFFLNWMKFFCRDVRPCVFTMVATSITMGHFHQTPLFARFVFKKSHPQFDFFCVFLQPEKLISICNMATVKQWFLAVRPWSFPASTMPALVAVAYIFFSHIGNLGSVDWLVAVACVLGALIFHFSGNLVSDYFDYKKGVDSENNIGQTNLLIINGVFKPKTILWYGIVLGLVGVALGIWIVCRTNLGVLYVGMAGFVLTFLYSFLKYNALGDLDVFLIFGVLIPLGTSFAVLGGADVPLLLAACPVGFQVVGILHANNTRDREIDRAAGTRTFAMLIGLKASKVYYAVLELLPYMFVIVLVIAKILPWPALAVLLSLPIALKNIKTMKMGEKPEDIAALDGDSAKLVLMYSMLLVVSLVISAFVL